MSYLDAVPNLGAQPSLKQLAYETLQRQIINGQLQPGSRLTEEELSRSMSISRAPIREALNMLERDGFTKIIPRRGRGGDRRFPAGCDQHLGGAGAA